MNKKLTTIGLGDLLLMDWNIAWSEKISTFTRQQIRRKISDTLNQTKITINPNLLKELNEIVNAE